MTIEDTHSRKAEAEVDSSFLDRWSPRSFKPDPLRKEQIMSLFEASRWAPSCFNAQSWIYVYAVTEPDRKKFLSLLVDKNQKWAKNAPLLLFIATRVQFTHNGRENLWAEFDAGSAWMSLALCARKLGLYAHGMAGFDRERAYDVLGIPKEKYKIMAAIAVGNKDDPSKLPEEFRESETPNSRKPLRKIYFEGTFRNDT